MPHICNLLTHVLTQKGHLNQIYIYISRVITISGAGVSQVSVRPLTSDSFFARVHKQSFDRH